VSEFNKDLPSTWLKTILDQIALIEMGQSPESKFYNDNGQGLPFYQGKAEFGERYPKVRKWCSNPNKIAEAGDILVSIRAPVGPTNIVQARSCIGRGLATVRAITPINQLFLFYFFRHIETWLSDQGTGSTFAAISGQFLRQIEFVLPPIGEQIRIVEKLEELLSDLDAGVAELKAAQKKLVQYRQSLLKAAVEGKLTEQWRNNRYAASPQYLTDQARDATANDTAANTPLSPRGRGVGGEGATTSGLPHNAWLRDRARELRKAQTPQEQALWQQLRAKRFSGFKFRRQQVIGRYIADFVCFEQKLVIELDGSQHSDTKQADAQRDHWLNGQGFRVLRFWNNQWQSQQTGVLEAIWQALHEDKPSPPLPTPSPTRGEGLSVTPDVDEKGSSGTQPDASFYHDERGAGEAVETGAQLLERILKERRARWEAKQLAKYQEQGKAPPKGWQDKYPEPVKPDTRDLPELPEGWVWTSIGQCFEVIVGATPSRKESSYWDGNIPWVSSGEVRFSRIASTKESITEEGLNNSSTKINPIGSVLLGMIGEGKTRGQVAILDIEAANNQNCAAIWVSETEIPSEYVYYWLWSQYEETRRGSSGNNQPALNKSIVERISLPLAPLMELKEIVNLVDSAITASIQQQKAFEFSLKQSAAQRQNILKAAFSGQLVPQDPNDEPASVLLERIRAERAAKQTVKTPKNRTTRSTS
jgi:very-short-patch-repair endonuclease/restriction endonuclease S subunit